jgi:hypothetical protein
MSSTVPAPYFPAPPAAYDQRYFSQVIRAFSVFVQQVNNPGPLQATALQLSPDGQASDTGQLTYNAAEDTLDLTHMNGVVQQLGFETYIRTKNDTGATIPNGTVVGFSGVNSEIKVAPYVADGSIPELYFVGVSTFDMEDQAVGPVTVYGKVRGLNTTGVPVGETWLAGDVIYASPFVAGGFTKVRPTAPDAVIVVAAVLRVSADDGEIMVRPTIPLGLDYGTFASTADQTLAATNTGVAITFNSTEISSGVTLGTPASRMVASEAGLYHLAVSVQLSSNSSSAKNVFFWLTQNGSAVPNTTRVVTISSNNSYFPFATAYDLSLLAGDYVEILWAADSTDVRLDAVTGVGFAPNAPSALVTVTQVQL